MGIKNILDEQQDYEKKLLHPYKDSTLKQKSKKSKSRRKKKKISKK